MFCWLYFGLNYVETVVAQCFKIKHNTFCVFFFSEIQPKSAFSNKESIQKDVKATVSQKAVLTCEVADSKTVVKWSKDGKLLTSSKTIHTEAKGGSRQLVIDSVEKRDTGEYICEAGNEKLTFNIQVAGRRNKMLLAFNY